MLSHMATRHESANIPCLPDYAFGERLGSGTCGSVYKARLISTIPSRPNSATSMCVTSPAPQFYAIKCISRKNLTKTTQDLLVNEIKILKHIKHENIVQMYDFQWDDNYIYIIMEYCSGGDMSMFIHSRRQLSEARARPFVQQIANALKFLHAKQISHMDLKPSNILLTSVDRPVVKIADFGVAQHIGEQGSNSIRGTLVYMAPEILSSHPYDSRVDLWSIGIILYQCLFGRSPFLFRTTDDLIVQIRADTPIEIPSSVSISAECRHLLEGLLQRSPDQRISFEDFFEHPFTVNDLHSQMSRADECLLLAIKAEQSGDLQAALNLHLQALDDYVAIINVDEDADRRRVLRMTVKQGVVTAEALKQRLKETTNNAGWTPPVASATIINTTDLDLNNNQELSDAYQHCLNGNQLMNDLMFAKAYEEYEKGLSAMLRIAPTETNPIKSKILRDVISHYLTVAEKCQQRGEAHRIDTAIDQIKENDASTTEESLNVQTHKRSVLESTCSPQ